MACSIQLVDQDGVTEIDLSANNLFGGVNNLNLSETVIGLETSSTKFSSEKPSMEETTKWVTNLGVATSQEQIASTIFAANGLRKTSLHTSKESSEKEGM